MLRLLLGLVIMFWIVSNLASQQKHIRGAVGQSEEEIRKIREKWLTKFPVSEDAVELEVIKSFPSKELIEEGVYLWRPLGLNQLPNGNIAVNDQKAHHILVFDENGNFIRKIGRKGQGPGEFGNPYSMTATSKAIIIGDNSNMRIQFFDFEGNYVRSFKIFKAFWDIESTHNELIYGISMRVRPEEEIVNVMDNDGVILNTFGKARFDIGKSNWLIPNMVTNISSNAKNELFLAFDYFPLVCRYNEKGKLLAEYKLNHDVMKEKEKINLNRFKNRKKGIGPMPVISSIQSTLNRFYVLSSYPRAEILEYDMNGQLKKEYFYEYMNKGDPHVSDFIIKEKGKEKIFYFLKKSQKNEIVILRPKESLSKERG
jgi:hypothetical protein